MPYYACAFYPNDDDLKLDVSYYLKTHMPMVQDNFGQYGLQGWEVIEFGRNADGTKPPYALQAILIWDKAESVSKALSSPEAPVVFGDVANFCNKMPISMVGPVVGSTRWNCLVNPEMGNVGLTTTKSSKVGIIEETVPA